MQNRNYGCNKTIATERCANTGKKVTLKDIANLKQKRRKAFNKNDLGDVTGLLKRQEGIVGLVIDLPYSLCQPLLDMHVGGSC